MPIDWAAMTWAPWKPGPFEDYDACATCGAWIAEPCFDRRIRWKNIPLWPDRELVAKVLYNKYPHKGRVKR